MSLRLLPPDSGEIQQKGVMQRGLAVALVPPGGAAVPGVHVRLQKKAMLIGAKASSVVSALSDVNCSVLTVN